MAILLFVGALLAASVCGGGTEVPRADTDAVSEAKRFQGFTLYYLGDSFHGLRLTHAGGPGRAGLRTWSSIYGTCTPSGGSEPSCAPPLEIQNWSICDRFAAIYPGRTPHTVTARGAETLPAGGGLDVYTGRTTVVIFGGDQRSVLKSLRRVADDRRPHVLPAPVPGSIDGELPCQAKRMKRFSQ
jgi:hypothetical protein